MKKEGVLLLLLAIIAIVGLLLMYSGSLSGGVVVSTPSLEIVGIAKGVQQGCRVEVVAEANGIVVGKGVVFENGVFSMVLREKWDQTPASSVDFFVAGFPCGSLDMNIVRDSLMQRQLGVILNCQKPITCRAYPSVYSNKMSSDFIPINKPLGYR